MAIGKKGLAGLSPADYARMAKAMLHYKLTFQDAFKLYGKYIGNWGGEATVWRFDAINNFEVVASVTCCPSAKLHLEVTPSATVLEEKQSYDMAAIRIRILDEFGNIAPYAQLPVKLTMEGAAELVGPDVVTAEGGMTGTFLKTVGKTGTAKLTVSTAQTEPVTVENKGSLFLKVSSITFSVVGETDDIYLGVIPRESVTWESADPSGAWPKPPPKKASALYRLPRSLPGDR